MVALGYVAVLLGCIIVGSFVGMVVAVVLRATVWNMKGGPE